MKKLFAVGCVMFLFIGCGKGQRASIMGLINSYRNSADSLVTYGNIEGYKYNGFNIIPAIMVNGDTLPLDDYNYGPTSFEYYGEVANLNTGAECELKVDYGEGKGEAKDTMPGEFRITAPDTSTILHKGNSLNITWQSTNGANWYWVYVGVDYYYIDKDGYWQEFEYELDTIIEGTSYTISSSTLWPNDVDSVLWGDGGIDVAAVSGPKLEPGAKGNINGDAVGFFWCSFDAKSVWFGIEQLAQKPKEDRQAEIRKKHLEILKEFARENM